MNQQRQRIDVGGAQFEAVVTGTGPITVVFENGLATALESWAAVLPAVAARTRTVRYDRRRAPATGDITPRTAADLAGDLRGLLKAFVAGLVLVDATHETVDSRGFALLPLMYSLMGLARRFGAGRRWLLNTLAPAGATASYRARLEQRVGDPAQWRIALRTARSEGAGIRPSLAALAQHCPDLPSIPVHVLTAGGVAGPNVKQIQRVHAAWKGMVSRAPHAQYTNVPSSGHQMPVEVPDVVADAIVGVLDTLAGFR